MTSDDDDLPGGNSSRNPPPGSSEEEMADMLTNYVAALIEESWEFWESKSESTEDHLSTDIFDEPYKSGPAKLWILTQQKGIDSDYSAWYVAALALKEDGSPVFLVHEQGSQLKMAKVEIRTLPSLANGFYSVDEQEVQARHADSDGERDSGEVPIPSREDIEPAKVSDDEWKYTVENPSEDATSIIIRRSSVLDHDSLRTYVIEQQGVNDNSGTPVALGTFWGHHAGIMGSMVEDVIEEVG